MESIFKSITMSCGFSIGRYPDHYLNLSIAQSFVVRDSRIANNNDIEAQIINLYILAGVRCSRTEEQ